MKKLYFIFAALLATLGMKAQWVTDLSKNTQITPSGVDYFDHEQMTTSQGNTFIYFICPQGTSSIKMRLQIVDKNGTRLLGRAGTTISSNRNKTWTTFNQLMALDKDENAIIPVWDQRDDDSSDGTIGGSYFIYKYDQTGQALWESKPLKHSIHLIEAGLSMLPTEDDGLLCSYFFTDTEAGADSLCMSRLDADGNLLWVKNIRAFGKWSSPYSYLVDAGNGNALLMWVDGYTLKAQIVDEATGELQLAHDATVYDAGFGSQKIWESLQVQPGPNHSALLSIFDGDEKARVALVNSDATCGLNGLNGVELTTGSLYKSTMPAVLYQPESNNLLCVYKTAYIDNTNLQGVYMQRVSMDGELSDANMFYEEDQNVMFAYFQLRPLNNGRTAMFFMEKFAGDLAVTGHWTVIEKGANEMGTINDFTTSGLSKETLYVSQPYCGLRFVTGWDQKPIGENHQYFMQEVAELEEASINAVTTMAKGHETYYDLAGRKVSQATKGLLIKHENGITTKVIK